MKLRSIRTLSNLAAAALLAAGSTRVAAQPPTPPATQPAKAPVLTPMPTMTTPVTSTPIMTMDSGPGCSSAFCPEKEDRFSVFGDFLLLKARGVDVHFAEIANGCGITASPVGGIANAETQYKPGFRLGGSYYLDNCSAVQLTYTWWEGLTSNAVVAPTGNVVDSLITAPSTVNCASDSLAAASRYRIEFQFVDLDYKHTLCSGCNYAVDWVAGLRYAHLDQNFGSRFDILGTTTVDTAINFDGIGPRFGLEGEQGLGRGFHLYGRGIVDILAGHFGSHFTQRNIFAGQQALAAFDDDRIVPILELELGVGWTNKSGCFRVETGYMIDGWFNTLTTSNLIDSVRSNNFSGNGDFLRNGIGFDGLTARLAFRF